MCGERERERERGNEASAWAPIHAESDDIHAHMSLPQHTPPKPHSPTCSCQTFHANEVAGQFLLHYRGFWTLLSMLPGIFARMHAGLDTRVLKASRDSWHITVFVEPKKKKMPEIDDRKTGRYYAAKSSKKETGGNRAKR